MQAVYARNSNQGMRNHGKRIAVLLLALGLGATFDDDITRYGIGVRLYFDR